MNNYINQIWEENNQWLTNFDGCALETYYLDVSAEKLSNALDKHKNLCSSYAMSLFRENQNSERDWDVVKEYIFSNENIPGNLLVDCGVKTKEFLFSYRMIISKNESIIGLFDINLIWWADQMFKIQQQNEQIFYMILEHFSFLMRLFGVNEFYLGLESPDDPRVDNEHWVKIISNML
jgi:hypothetical protein